MFLAQTVGLANGTASQKLSLCVLTRVAHIMIITRTDL